MVDKIRKAAWILWLFKERLILLVMVGALANQVYLLLNPAPPELPPPLPAPSKTMSETVNPAIVPPPPPGPMSDGTGGGGFGALVDRNPYWYYSSTGEDTKSKEVPADLIQLVTIKKTGNRIRCQLKTRTTVKWYEVGDKFEEFVLENIDMDAGTATVFVESYGQRVELTAQG
jgi:hypothetical protein